MASQNAIVFASTLEKLLDTKGYPLTAIALNQGVKFKPTTDSSGRTIYVLQRAKRKKSQARTPKTGAPATDALSILNQFTKTEWESISPKYSVERVIGTNYDLREDKVVDLSGEMTQEQIASQAETVLVEAEEVLTEYVANIGFNGTALTSFGTALTGTDTPAGALKAYEQFKADSRKIQLSSDEFKYMVAQENVVAVFHPNFLDRVASIAGMAYVPHEQVLENGFPMEGSLNGTKYITSPIFNTYTATIGGVAHKLAYAVLYKDAVAMQSPTQTMLMFNDFISGTTFVGARFWTTIALVDSIRIYCCYVPTTELGNVAPSKKVSA